MRETLIAAAAAFIAAGAYYTVFVAQLGGDERMPLWKLAVEVGRCVLLAAVVSGLASRGGIDEPLEGMLLGLVLWLGFPVVLWVGAIVHERTPLKLAALHGGDWLIKLLLVGAIVSAL